MNRAKLLSIIEPSYDKNTPFISHLYDIFMFLMIVISLIPLMYRGESIMFYLFEKISVSAFIVDYILRWITADIKYPEKKKWVAFVTYPFTVIAIIDLLSILPALGLLHRSLKALRVIRVFMLVRIIRLIRYMKRIWTLLYVLKKERVVLLTVLAIAMFYIFATALIMYNVEMYRELPDGSLVFESFLDALYWSTTTLTTIGYGDIYPVSDVGKIITIISSILGVAIIALPTGVITAGYLDELRKYRKDKE
ncbi:MAG: ion transporter [Bacteroidales bacterium]|nr:ion transporter [Bacteroidales bacterium]